MGTAEVDPVGELPVTLIGREIAGRYRIKTMLGEGGMGAVYKAEQISLKRVVALKLLKPELVSSAPLLRRFNAEAEAVAKLSHPNTVGIYDFGQDRDGTLFIAMEYVEGKSLRAMLIAEGPFPPLRALHITGQIAASLSDAHASGIIHRDLKPDNIMLQERGRQRDVVRVLDFGIAKLRDDSRMTQQSMTQAGDVLGTPQYMSPEQIRGEEIDGRADVYSLGAMLYEMLTGRMVFEAGSLVALLSKHLLDQPEAPSRRRPELRISAELDELVMACLAKEPRARLASMDQVTEVVGRLLPAYGAPMSSSDVMALAARAGSSGSGGELPIGQGVPTSPPPASYGGMQPQPTPPPPGPASYGAAGGYSPYPGQPGPPGPYPGPYAPPGDAGYGAYSPHAAPAPGYAPYPPPPHVPTPAPRPAPRSSAGLVLAILATLAVVGGGGAYYFLVYQKKAPTTVEVPAPGPGSGSGSGETPASPWGEGSGSGVGSGSGSADADAPGGDDQDQDHDPTVEPARGGLNKPMRAPKIGDIGVIGGTLYTAPSAFRLLVPPELSMHPKLEATPDGMASSWTFMGPDGTDVGVSVVHSAVAPEIDEDDPGETVRMFGMSGGMAMVSWRWRPIGGGQRALSGTYTVTRDGRRVFVEAVLYIKKQGFLVVLFACPSSAFDDSEEYREILFTKRISW
jgi:serine/threonine protein kinase